MIEIVYRVDGREHVFPLEKPEVVLGRSPDADLSIDSLTVSRFHARIRKDARELVITDLDSRNKTKVNSVVVKEARLSSGDKIALGDFEMEVRERAEKVVLDEAPSLPAPSETVMRSAEEVRKLLEVAAADATVRAGAARPPEVDQLAKSNRILRALMKAGEALISEDTLQGLLDKVMDLVFDNIAAERGMLGLYEGDTLSFKVVRYRRAGRKEETIVIPKAITAKVRTDKVSILSTDAQQEFDGSRSVLSLGIRSALCVPLFYKGTVIGIIYVDEDRHTGKFTSDDLDLLSALASYAAVAIERQRLTDRIQEEQATRAKLERYHSPGVVDRILRSGAAADTMDMAEHEITVSFTDIVGFTSMSEVLEPRDVGMAINELFTELTECIFRYEGTLDKYIGDCIMAVFGAPVDMADHAVRCVRAALEMQEALEKLNAEKGERPRMQLRIGINSGRAVAGDFGSPKRRDYSVLGDAVNLASRLESSVSQPGWIVIGEATYEAVKAYFDCQFLGAQNVKGKKAQIGAYRVLKEKPGAFSG
jgi:adenylate cyclase